MQLCYKADTTRRGYLYHDNVSVISCALRAHGSSSSRSLKVVPVAVSHGIDFSIGDWGIAVCVVREPLERPKQSLEEV